VDSHLALPRCDADAATLEGRELAPFRAHAGADAMMSAHLVVPALDPELRPATFSPPMLQGVLRERLGFHGVCITDALEMRGAAAGREPAEEARLALAAGCDLLLFAEHDEKVRRARLELARMLVDGHLDRANFDAARPRLAALDARSREPSSDELSRPIESLTPPGWVERLEAIVERGIEVTEGRADRVAAARSAAGGWSVTEPACADGPTIRDALASAGIPVSDAAGEVHLEAYASRIPLPLAERRRLAERCRERPTIVVALQSDEALADLEDAALRVSACDPTALTRRVVAGRIVAWARGALRPS
jgi:beta-N-acetylhexosaminidase